MSYEKEIHEKLEENKALPNKIDIPVLKYFWQANPLSSRRKNTIPKFLKEIGVFKEFTDFELRTLSKFFHIRTFQPKETIFDQGDPGVGFYLIFTGHIEILYKDGPDDVALKDITEKDLRTPILERHITLLEKHDCFGELALLQENSFRTAAAVARDTAVLLGIFRPDIEDLIHYNPAVAAKLLKSISLIVANRFSSVTKEIKILKYKIRKLEHKND